MFDKEERVQNLIVYLRVPKPATLLTHKLSHVLGYQGASKMMASIRRLNHRYNFDVYIRSVKNPDKEDTATKNLHTLIWKNYDK